MSDNFLTVSPIRSSRPPAWFRYGIIAVAMVLLCSCTAAQPEYRVANTTSTAVRGQSPPVIEMRPKSELKLLDVDEAEQPQLEQEVIVEDEALIEGAEIASDEIELAAAEMPADDLQDSVTPAQCQAAGPATTPCAGTDCVCCNMAAIRGPIDEYLCDGGDYGLPVGVRADWKIEGLEQEDTVAHYDTIDGRTVVTPSNKVCIYAPRFAAIRQITDLRAYARYDAVAGAIQPLSPAKIDDQEEASSTLAGLEAKIDRLKEPPSLLRERDQAGELDRDRRVAATIGSLAPYANLEIVRSGEIIGQDQVRIARASLAAITWAGDQAAQVVLNGRRAHADVSVKSPGTIYHLFEPNNPKLRLCKLASKGAALPGEEVEFTLRFDNVGDRVIGNVTIADNLTTRLEYVADSQKSSLPANFSTQTNEGDSLVLRWEIIEPLQPGKGGILQFKARVR